MPSGGTAPYSVTLYESLGLPVGLSFSNGVITGTPSSAGNYLIAAIVGDAAGHFLLKIYPLVVDNAAGEAPGLALSPKPIQIYSAMRSPNPAPIQVGVSTTTGAKPFTLAMSNIPGVSLSSAAGTTNTTVNLNLTLTSMSEGSYSGLLAGAAPGAVNFFDSVPFAHNRTRAWMHLHRQPDGAKRANRRRSIQDVLGIHGSRLPLGRNPVRSLDHDHVRLERHREWQRRAYRSRPIPDPRIARAASRSTA